MTSPTVREALEALSPKLLGHLAQWIRAREAVWPVDSPSAMVRVADDLDRLAAALATQRDAGEYDHGDRDVRVLWARGEVCERCSHALCKRVRDAGEGPQMFRLGAFTLHSGKKSSWKIDCDALTPADWTALAWMMSDRIGAFSAVEGVPRGGLKFADALRALVSREGPLLIVDDVLTTGASMEQQRAGRDAIGAVVFARGPVPSWITPLFVDGRVAARDGERGETRAQAIREAIEVVKRAGTSIFGRTMMVDPPVIVAALERLLSTPLPVEAPPRPAAEGARRCKSSGNLCGTDTWALVYNCPCSECQAWLRERSVAAEGAEGEVERVAKAIYETQEQLRADDDIPGSPWVPWEAQTSYRERRIARAMAEAAIAALRTRPPLDGAELARVAQVLYEAHPQAGAWPALDSQGRQVWFGIARVAEAVLRARPEGRT